MRKDVSFHLYVTKRVILVLRREHFCCSGSLFGSQRRRKGLRKRMSKRKHSSTKEKTLNHTEEIVDPTEEARPFGQDDGWGKEHFLDDATLHVQARASLKRTIEQNGALKDSNYAFAVFDFRDKGHVEAMARFKRAMRVENALSKPKGLKKTADLTVSDFPIGEEHVFFYEDSAEDPCNVCFVAFHDGKKHGAERGGGRGGGEEESTNPLKKEIASVMLCKVLRPLKNVEDPLLALRILDEMASTTKTAAFWKWRSTGSTLNVPIFFRGLEEDYPSTYASENVFCILGAATRKKHAGRGLSIGLHYVAVKFAVDNANLLDVSMVVAHYVSTVALSIGMNKFQMQTLTDIDDMGGSFKRYELRDGSDLPQEDFPSKKSTVTSTINNLESANLNWRVDRLDSLVKRINENRTGFRKEKAKGRWGIRYFSSNSFPRSSSSFRTMCSSLSPPFATLQT